MSDPCSLDHSRTFCTTISCFKHSVFHWAQQCVFQTHSYFYPVLRNNFSTHRTPSASTQCGRLPPPTHCGCSVRRNAATRRCAAAWTQCEWRKVELPSQPVTCGASGRGWESSSWQRLGSKSAPISRRLPHPRTHCGVHSTHTHPPPRSHTHSPGHHPATHSVSQSLGAPHSLSQSLGAPRSRPPVAPSEWVGGGVTLRPQPH